MKNQVDNIRGFAQKSSLAHFLNSSLSKAELNQVIEDMLSGETKLLYVAPETLKKEETIDPLNSPIADLQMQRSKERRLKMKEFNYKFNNSKIDDIEKEPAYKRHGIDLEEVRHSSENNESRLTLNLDENDDIQLRTNNSFLHDNVD